MERLSGLWHFIVTFTKLLLNWMCEISALQHKQTETKEHEVEIGSVSKRGGGSTSGVQGHHKPQHVPSEQCQQGRKFFTHLESISHRKWRTWKRRIRETLKYCILSYWIWSPVLRFLFFTLLHGICKLGDPENASKSQTKTLWPRKRVDEGKVIVLGFSLE